MQKQNFENYLVKAVEPYIFLLAEKITTLLILNFSMANVIMGFDSRVYNVNGTSGCKPTDGLWKTFWIRKSGRQWPKRCRIWGCGKLAHGGAHVMIDDKYDYYIFSMCQTCNTCRLDQWLKVNVNSLAVPVREEDTCGTGNCFRT